MSACSKICVSAVNASIRFFAGKIFYRVPFKQKRCLCVSMSPHEIEVLMRKCVLFALINLALTVPAVAQATNGDTDKKDNIRHLMRVMGAEKLAQTMFDQYLQAMKPILAQASLNDEEVRKRLDRFSEIMSEEFKQ